MSDLRNQIESLSAAGKAELLDADKLRAKVRAIVAIKNKIFAALYGAQPMDAAAIAEQFVEIGRQLAPMVRNTGALLRAAWAGDARSGRLGRASVATAFVQAHPSLDDLFPPPT